MAVHLINIGYGNFISAVRIVAVVDADSAPVKRSVTEARKAGNLVDATLGHKTRSVLVMDSGHLVLSAKSTETLAASCQAPSPEQRAATTAAREGSAAEHSKGEPSWDV
jgi:extracellular matrix regulatory protein A